MTFAVSPATQTYLYLQGAQIRCVLKRRNDFRCGRATNDLQTEDQAISAAALDSPKPEPWASR
jgi:hypothetical protein